MSRVAVVFIYTRTRTSCLRQKLRGLSLGSDAHGPVLALWSPETRQSDSFFTRFCFLDLDSLTVLKLGSIALGRMAEVRPDQSLSGSRGSFVLDQYMGERRGSRVYLRASAGGALFGIWQLPMLFRFVTAQGQSLRATYTSGEFGYVAPGPDDRTVFHGLGGRCDVDGKPIGQVEPFNPNQPRTISLPSSDPFYYLTIGGLPSVVADPFHVSSKPGAVTASVHAAGDGSRLLTVYGLDEMAGTVKMEDWFPDDVTTDKRFHLVPAAHLLITIPPANDRLVLRRLELDAALSRPGGDRLIVVSPPNLDATTGQTFEHRIIARSKQGGVTYTMASGPDGLKVSPDGRLTWTVPQGLAGEEVTVVVTVGDASGEELFHTLKIRVK